MPRCYFPVVPFLFLLESARITGEAATEVTISPPTRVPASESLPFSSVAETVGGMGVTSGAATAVDTAGSLPSSVALLSDTTNWLSTLGERGLPGEATVLPSSSSPEGTQDVSVAFSSFAVATAPSPILGGSSEGGRTHSAESTVTFSSSTAGDTTCKSYAHSPPRGKTIPEGLSTAMSVTPHAGTTVKKHASSPPTTARATKVSPVSSTSEAPMLPSAISAAGDATTYSEMTSWWPGGSSSSTSSSSSQNRSTPKAASTGPVSSNPERASVRLATPSSTTEGSAATLKVLSSSTTTPSASKGPPKIPIKAHFILFVGLSTPLNVTDPFVRGAVLQWLDLELRARFPVGSFSLAWKGSQRT